MDDLREIASLFDSLYQKLGRHYGELSRPQRRFMQAIARADGIGVTSLSEVFEMTVAGATRMLDKLESDGYVERHRQTDDARHVKIYVTEKGRRVLAEADAIHLVRLSQLLSSLTPEELVVLKETLSKVK